jgi:hypothetical protein
MRTGVPPENKAQARIRSSENCRWPAFASGRHRALKTPARQTLQFFVPRAVPGRGRRFRKQFSSLYSRQCFTNGAGHIVACRQLRRDVTILLQVLFGTQFVMWHVTSRLSALRLPNGVTIVSVKATMGALEDTAYLRMAAKGNAGVRQEFMNQVNARMLRAIDSHANFVLLNPLRPVSAVLLRLEKCDVHVAPPIPAMERYIRVSLGTPSEMREFWRVGELLPAGNLAM